MRRTLFLLLALTFTVPFLASCGDDGGGTDEASPSADAGSDDSGDDSAGEEETEGGGDLGAIELIRSAPDALEGAGTAHLEMTIDAGPVTIAATGQFDFGAQSGAMTMELPPPAGGEIEMVFDGTTYFMSADAFGAALPGVDAEWIRVDVADLAAESGIDPSQLPQGTNNPADALDALAAVSEDGLEEVGTEDVRGVETTHYTAEIDMAAALEQAEGAIDDATADQFLAQYGDEPVPVEIWIDGDGLVHRQTMTIPIAGQEASMQMEMFDYGEPVDIQIPDPADSIGLDELLGSIGAPTDN